VVRHLPNAPSKKAARRRPQYLRSSSLTSGESALAPEIGHDANPRKPIGGLDKREGSGAPECDGACEGSGPGPHGVAVVAALHTPLAVFMADKLPDVMAPHHDGADLGTAGV
jgi:hypothetical protein